jgi:hypothetical protein
MPARVPALRVLAGPPATCWQSLSFSLPPDAGRMPAFLKCNFQFIVSDLSLTISSDNAILCLNWKWILE